MAAAKPFCESSVIRILQIIVVEQRDRLMRFGSEFPKTFEVAQPEEERQQQQAQIGHAAGPLARISNVRQDWLHQTTSRLVHEFSVIAIEDLNVRGLMTTEKLARNIADIGFHEFRRQLEYKARLYGKDFVTASRWFPSSKICSACGRIAEELPYHPGVDLRVWYVPRPGN